jgi:formylmethanofuran dehydrogenase subunit C
VSVPPIIDTRYVKIAGDTMTGNLVIDGSNSLTVGGVTTIGGTVSVNATTSLLLALNSTNANGGYLRIMKSGATEFFIGTRDSVSGTSGTGYDIYTIAGNDLKFFTNGTNLALTLDTSQNATFAGTIDSGTITSTGVVKAATTFQSTSGSMLFFVSNA